jgi:two-component sensor histidine kinase
MDAATQGAANRIGMTLVNAPTDQLNATFRSENHNGARFVLTFEPKD